MNQAIIDLYDEYTHAPLDRRVFLARLTQIAGSAGAAAAILSALEPNYAHAETVAPDDARLAVETIEYPGATGPVRGYLAKPDDMTDELPGVIVIHENRGLNPHIEDVARRVALGGFVALATDLLSPLGGTPADPDAARDMIGQLDAAQTVQNLVAAIDYLRGRPDSNGKVGAVGFCWGGGAVGNLAVAAGDKLDAGVVFYGPVPAPADVPKIRAALLLNYAGIDDWVNEGVPGFRAALDAAGAQYTAYIYENAQHAFNNDTSAERYNAEAATLAWERTMAFFDETLKG